MKHFVQLKDGVVFAYHQSSTEEDLPGDDIIQVNEDGANFLKKKYENGTFVDAPIIKYAVLDSNNIVVSIGTTVYSSDVPANAKVCNDSVNIQWVWSESGFVEPNLILPVTQPTPQIEDISHLLEDTPQPE